MRTPLKLIAGIALTVAVSVPGFSIVAADPEFNDHNCAGVVVSSFAGPGFGQEVAALAHEQTVDNLGLANCGQTNRKNP